MIDIQLDLINCGLKFFRSSGPSVKINISEVALLKITGLVEAFDGEVGWHGTVNRTAANTFTIEDIFVYPQDASAASIDTDQLKYEMWLMSQDDDIFKRLRMHGHSHANFSSTPSAKDDRHRKGLTAQLTPGMFYIFMIFNKDYKTHSYVHYSPEKPHGPENVKLYVTLSGKRMPFKKLSIKTLKHLLDCDMVREFVAAARKAINEGRMAC